MKKLSYIHCLCTRAALCLDDGVGYVLIQPCPDTLLMPACPGTESHLFGLLGHINHSVLLCLTAWEPVEFTHNAPVYQDWQTKLWEIKCLDFSDRNKHWVMQMKRRCAFVSFSFSLVTAVSRHFNLECKVKALVNAQAQAEVWSYMNDPLLNIN